MYPNDVYEDFYKQYQMQFPEDDLFNEEYRQNSLYAEYDQYPEYKNYQDKKSYPQEKCYPDKKPLPEKKPCHYPEKKKYPEYKQAHVHEIQGSTMIAEKECDPHNHRFCTVSGEAKRIACGHDHYHEVKFTTDTFKDHQHEFCGKTSAAIYVGDGRHVHFLKGCTSVNDKHYHPFRVATLIENPIACK